MLHLSPGQGRSTQTLFPELLEQGQISRPLRALPGLPAGGGSNMAAVPFTLRSVSGTTVQPSGRISNEESQRKATKAC